MSTRAGVARPVRSPRSSSRNTLTAFSIRSSASKRISSVVIILSFADQCPDWLAGDSAFDVALALEVEDQDRHLGLAAQANGRHVHHSQIIAEHLGECQLFIANRVGILLGIVAINAVDAGGLK